MGARLGGSAERPATFFDGVEDFRDWLERNHATATELWVGFHKKHVPDRGLTYPEAVPEALCWGWIDSVAQRIDEDATRQRWTPRKPGSIWSKVNLAHVERLIAEGRMRPAGLAAWERRKDDRQGIYSFEQAESGVLPDEYEALLRAHRSAADFFYATATPSYRKMAIHWVTSAKQQATRDRRAAQLVDSCAEGRLIPPMRYGEIPTWARGDGSPNA